MPGSLLRSRRRPGERRSRSLASWARWRRRFNRTIPNPSTPLSNGSPSSTCECSNSFFFFLIELIDVCRFVRLYTTGRNDELLTSSISVYSILPCYVCFLFICNQFAGSVSFLVLRNQTYLIACVTVLLFSGWTGSEILRVRILATSYYWSIIF